MDKSEVTVQEFMNIINGSRNQIGQKDITRETAIKFLSARKYDITRATSLYEQHELIRYREGLYNLNPSVDPLFSELETGKFTILPGRDTNGAAIALFTAHLHSPLNVTHKTTLQGVVYQLDCALQNSETQNSGLIFIYDMSSSKYSNFDYDLSQKILTLLKGGYPARLKKVLIVTAPLWFKAPFKILRLFVREKLRERVFTVSIPQLTLHIPRESLPVRLGGSLQINHSTWLLHCYKSMTNREDELLANIWQPTGNQISSTTPTSAATTTTTINTTTSNAIQKTDTSLAESTTTATTTTTTTTTTTSSTTTTTIQPLTLATTIPLTDIVCDQGTTNNNNLIHNQHHHHHHHHHHNNNNNNINSHHNENNNCSINSNGQQQAQPTHQLHNHHLNNHLNELWSENPPSSASSGFSDDDSLAGTEGDPKTIEQIVKMVKERGRNGLIKEYGDIRSRTPEGTFENARMRTNLSKNRYTDVLCFDHSRVILSQENDEPTSDYINANFVDGYKQRNAYISTQGPLPKTSSDFWRMIWEQHCLLVVMTTKVTERGRIKCGQYWETTEGNCCEHGNYRIRTTNVVTHEDYTVVSLELTNIKTEETRNVSHYQFTSWPDYGVPPSAAAMLTFLQCVREQQVAMVKALGDTWAGHPRGPPIVVHCSAGIGRTGTFITLDICISRLEDVGTADIRGTVEKIRTQRAYSIQMPDQYVFCHLALIEYAISRGMLISPDLSEFDDHNDDSD